MLTTAAAVEWYLNPVDWAEFKFLPRSKLIAVRLLKTTQLMPYREMSTVSSGIRIKHAYFFCEQNVEFLNDKPGVSWSNHWALKGSRLDFQFSGDHES
jgi:hypothetical protein